MLQGLKRYVAAFFDHIAYVATGALKSQVLENASTKNASTKQDILQGWKMQVLKTQVRVRKGGKRKYVYL